MARVTGSLYRDEMHAPRTLAWPFRLSMVLAPPLALSAPGCSSSVDGSSESPGDAGNMTSDGDAGANTARDVVGPQPDVSAAGDAIGDDSATEDVNAAQDGPLADANESSTDAGTHDVAWSPDADASDDESDVGTACAWSGAPGQCMAVAACVALPDHTSYSGGCSGPATIECCIKTPSTADNPPIPAGYHLMQQSQVTPEMTAWAVSILNDPATYPMFATATMTFGALVVLARVEWSPPDFQNGAVHRGVTLYVQ
jgi:hypothetical protein